MASALEGYWLPRSVRDRVARSATWEVAWLKGGASVPEGTEGAVAVTWPRLDRAVLGAMWDHFQQSRRLRGREALPRFCAALTAAQADLETRIGDLNSLSAATGYSLPMLAAALSGADLVDAGLLSAALAFEPDWTVARRWSKPPGLPGHFRFFPHQLFDRVAARVRGRNPLSGPAAPIDLTLGFAAGNVPGTGLIMALLGLLANDASGDRVLAPAVLVRNSRHEPLFTPWVLGAVESVDPDLAAHLALLVWDYDDLTLQRELMGHAGLMIAAAGDQAIASLEAERRACAPSLRFHRHGHKVSFSVVDSSLAVAGCGESDIALLGAIDSSLWDQNGCLSARIHFVSGDAQAYADALTAAMRRVAAALPRGSTPRRLVHRAFDSYRALTDTSGVRVCSTWDDDFAVIVDDRAWRAETLQRAINACQGRVVVVRSVPDIMDVASILTWLPPENLQSVSLAIRPDRLLEFAEAVGRCGVTALRSLGRAAFSRLAYSWDGLLPLDVARLRPPGHFTTIEFDDLEEELAETAALWRERMGLL